MLNEKVLLASYLKFTFYYMYYNLYVCRENNFYDVSKDNLINE